MESLLHDCLQHHTVKNIAETLGVSPGTIHRWLKLQNVPLHYKADLLRILSRDIDYATFTSKEKDQFFTDPDVARYCWDIFVSKNLVDLKKYTFIEPSAGSGSFLHVLPPGSIALDIEPRHPDIQKQDYLQWTPPNGKDYIVFGNPPFGLRGHLALQFINHSEPFADVVCFILPQLFESDGKGSPRKRITGFNLLHSEKLNTVFRTPEGTNVDVNVVFQIWSKHQENPEYTIRDLPTDILRVYSLSDGGDVSSTRNKAMIGKCDVYLPSTCFGEDAMKVYDSFEDLPNRKGYGIVFHQLKEELIEKSKNIDWVNVSFRSTNSALNLRTSIICDQFTQSSDE
jgi:hypothetical protein